MIPYLEIRDRYTREAVALVEPSECWFELSYYDIGAFEIYAPATAETVNSLKVGRFVTIPNKPYLWTITALRYEFKADGTRMISATGYEAKWLLTQRLVYSQVDTYGDIGQTVGWLVSKSMGPLANSARQIPGLVVKETEIEILTDLQLERGNLWEVLSPFLKANMCGCAIYLRNGALSFETYIGRDRSENVVFSQSMDNLLSSSYASDSEARKTFCLVVNKFTEQNAQGENVENEYTLEVGGGESNPLDRFEMMTSPSLSLKYTDESGAEKETTPTSDTFKGWQKTAGEAALAENVSTETIDGEVDTSLSQYAFEVDYYLGDLVKVIDEDIGVPFFPIVSNVTIKQDATGYGLEVAYEKSE